MKRPFAAGWLGRLVPSGYVDVSKVMSGTFLRNLLRGVFKVLIAGFLTTQSFGILRSIFSLFKILESLADLGLDYATVIFVPAAIGRGDEAQAERTLRTVLGLKLVLVALLAGVGQLFAPMLTRSVFSDPALTVWVRLAFLAAGGQLLWKYLSSYLSSRQDFTRLALFLVSTPLLMLIIAGALILTDHFSLSAGILINLFAPAVIAILWWLYLARRMPSSPRWDGVLARRILRFSRWPYLSSIASANRNHLNPLLLKNAALSGSVAQGEINAGLYAFGNDLANELTVLSQSMMTVLLPKASSHAGGEELRRFVRRSYRHLPFVLLALLPLLLLARPALLLLGQLKPSYLEYLPSLQVFAILYVGLLFSLAAIPIQSALYAMRMPQVETALELLMIVALVVGGLLMIPRYGAEGAALVVLVQRVLSFAILLGYGLFKLRRFEQAAE